MLAVSHALALAVSVGQGSAPADPAIPYQQVSAVPHGQYDQGGGGRQGQQHVQQEVLEEPDAVDGGAQVGGTVVTEHVVDPVDGPRYRVVRLVPVDRGEELCLAAVPAGRGRGSEGIDDDGKFFLLLSLL